MDINKEIKNNQNRIMTLLFIGTTELLLIAGVALLIFGGKKVPELMKGLGKGVKSFKQGMNEPLEESKPEEMKDEAEAERKEANGAGK
ncbi:twin-arginine translocase TatA/TatE family subunit [Prevotella sp. E13-27]|uniref:Sec-independent protein translocase subunit TatA/TatB n=1 Tax=Prevotella sp. E13-27 TaxID=2938122 RepID=UPI00397C834F